MKLSTGMSISIHSYKHNKKIHRIWKKSLCLYQDSKLLITANNRTRVIESDGRSWHTKEPAVCYFYSDLWFNIIGMLKKDGIYFYCNLSSPYLYDGEAIKYIDYDLDIKVFPNGSYTLLDEKEYISHLGTMSYPQEIQEIINTHKKILIDRITKKEHPFDMSDIEFYYEHYKTLQKKTTK
jgi:protein associated with RNAse G/E